jgi:3-oxoacyl-[acyl-carrier-protein] synthase II
MKALVTGVGCVTPIGIGFSAFADALRRGVSGVGRVTHFDASHYFSKIAAEVRDFDPAVFMDLREAKALPRVAQFSLAAAHLAVRHAGIRDWSDAGRVAMVVGTSSGAVSYTLEQHAIFLEKGMRRVHPSMPAYAHNSIVASEPSIQLDIHGPVFAVSSACTSAVDAIGIGCGMLAAGIADVLLVGGADAPICPAVFAAFDRLGMLPRGYEDRPEVAARPFDVDRSGLVLGEGAGILVLETAAHARARGARGLVAISGYGASCDAKSHFRQEESGADAERAIRDALRSAGLEPSAVQYVNAHGTGTRENDPFESKVLDRVFGGSVAWVSSSKSQFGHLLGACGAVEAIACIAAVLGKFVPPTVNLDRLDPACAALRYVGGAARDVAIDNAVSVSFGFGSRNAALLIERLE